MARPMSRRRRRELEPFFAGLQNAVNVAKLFADISRQAAAEANRRRLEAAQRNIQAGEAQLNLEETVERRNIAQALVRHVGTLRVNSAFRGTGGAPSTLAAETGAGMQAAQAASVTSANTAFRLQALLEQNLVELEDENLAALEGGLRGFSTGMQIQSALDALTFKTEIPVSGGGDPRYGGTPLRGGQTIFTTPTLNFGDIFGGGDVDFQALFGGLFGG